MVLEVLAHAGQVGDHRNAELPQLLGRADAGEHQQLRRGEGAGGEDRLALGHGHLLATAAAVADSARAAVADLDAEHLGPGDNAEVLATRCRSQICVSGAPAPAVALGHLGERGAVLLVTVVVGDARDAGLRAGVEELAGEPARRALVLDPQRPVDGMVL